MNPPGRRVAAGAALLWTLWSGCATAPSDPPLEVSVVHLRFTSASVFETVARAELRLENLSSEDLQITGASHKLTINGVRIGRGLSPDTLGVPRFSGVNQEVECHLRNGALAKVIGDLARGRGTSATYVLASSLQVARGGRSRTLQLEKSGTLDLKDWMPAGNPR